MMGDFRPFDSAGAKPSCLDADNQNLLCSRLGEPSIGFPHKCGCPAKKRVAQSWVFFFSCGALLRSVSTVFVEGLP
jgi:hypothetical protein